MDLTTDPAFRDFRSALLDTPARDLAATLYGPAWDSSVTETERAWRTRRLPKAVYLLPLLSPLLAGRIAFDGRSHRESRTGGWWARHAEAGWHPVSLPTIARALHAVADPLLEEAQGAAEREGARYRDLTLGLPETTSLYQHRRPHREALLRVALLGALSAFIASDAERTIGSVAAYLRDDPAFALGDDDAEAIIRGHLDEVCSVEDWEPGARVPTRELVDAFTRAGCTLPTRLFLRVAPRVFGDRRVVQGFRYFEVPDTA